MDWQISHCWLECCLLTGSVLMETPFRIKYPDPFLWLELGSKNDKFSQTVHHGWQFSQKILIIPVALCAVINFPVQNYRSKSGKISKIPAKCEEIRVKLCKYHKKWPKTRIFFLIFPVILPIPRFQDSMPSGRRIIENCHPCCSPSRSLVCPITRCCCCCRWSRLRHGPSPSDQLPSLIQLNPKVQCLVKNI